MPGNQTNNNNSINPKGSNSQISVAGAVSSSPKTNSPWEEEIDVPKADQKAPAVIGSLDPNTKKENKPFDLPEDIEEKVGSKIPAANIIGQKPVENSVPRAEEVPSNLSSVPLKADLKATNNLSPTLTSISNSKPNIDLAASNSSPSVVPAANIKPNTNATSINDKAASISKDIKPNADIGSKPNTNKTVPARDNQLDGMDYGFDWFGTSMPESKSTDLNKSIPVKAVSNQAEPKPKTNPGETVSPISSGPAVSSSIQAAVQVSNPTPPTSSQSVSNEKNAKDNVMSQKNSKINQIASMGAKKLLLLIMGLLAVIIIILIGLTEFGVVNVGAEKVYGSFGLEKIWGGLPNSSEKAILRSAIVMKNHPNFKAKGRIDLTIDGSIKSDITSPLVENIIKPDASSKIKNIEGNIGFVTNDNASEADIVLGGDIENNQISLKSIGEKLYVSGNDKVKFGSNSDPKKWVLYEISSLKEQAIQNGFFDVKDTSGLSAKGIRVGNEKVSNERCYRYKLEELELGNALSPVGITSDMVQSISGDVWIGIKDKTIRRVSLKITTPVSFSTSMIDLDLELYDFDNPNEIQTAENDKIVKPANTQYSGDIKRKSDVENILAALKKYKKEVGSFPNSNDQLINLSNSDNILKSKLIPNYLSSLPVDENSDKGWYYAYKSNGVKCSVSARLENLSDPDGQLINNTLLYLRYNSD